MGRIHSYHGPSGMAYGRRCLCEKRKGFGGLAKPWSLKPWWPDLLILPTPGPPASLELSSWVPNHNLHTKLNVWRPCVSPWLRLMSCCVSEQVRSSAPLHSPRELAYKRPMRPFPLLMPGCCHDGFTELQSLKMGSLTKVPTTSVTL